MNTLRSLLVVGVVGLLLVSGASVPVAAQDQVTLTVTVETPSGATVSGAELTASWSNGSRTATTSASGKALLDVPKGANVTITVDHQDWVRNNPVEVTDAEEESVTMRVYDKASATINVDDSTSPVDGARVRLYNHGRVAVDEQTDSGVLRTGTIERGSYLLIVSKPGYLVKRMRIDVVNETTQQVDIERGTVTMYFNVTDPHFSPPRPIDGISANVEGIGTVKTQSTGKQQLNVPVNTDLTVTVGGQQYETVERTVHTNESDVHLDLSIDRTPALSVNALSKRVVVGESVPIEVANEYDEPVADASVILDGEHATSTNGEGRAQVKIAEAGNHTIEVANGDLQSEPVTVTGVRAATSSTETTEATTTNRTSTTTAAPTTESPVPGFGPLAALVGMLAGLGLLARRRIE